LDRWIGTVGEKEITPYHKGTWLDRWDRACAKGKRNGMAQEKPRISICPAELRIGA